MLFDLKKKEKKKRTKMSKHLIGIDAEVYILYEDKVLLKSREKKVDSSYHFSSVFPFINKIPLL